MDKHATCCLFWSFQEFRHQRIKGGRSLRTSKTSIAPRYQRVIYQRILTNDYLRVNNLRMEFKTFFFGLPPDAREDFAKRANTSKAYCLQVAYGNKRLELGMADVFAAVSGGAVGLTELPLTDRAAIQKATRETPEPGSAKETV